MRLSRFDLGVLLVVAALAAGFFCTGIVLSEKSNGGTLVTPAAGSGLEGDLGSRPNGDGILLVNDVIIARLMVTDVITPQPGSNEFQRADVAPLATRGDGFIDASDVVQIRRYVLGLDPINPAGGPDQPPTPTPTLTPTPTVTPTITPTATPTITPTPIPQLEVLYDKLGNAATGWGWVGQGIYTSTFSQTLGANYVVVTNFIGSVSAPKRIRKIEIAGAARNTVSGSNIPMSYFDNLFWIGIWNGNVQSFANSPLGGSLTRFQMPVPDLGSTTVPAGTTGSSNVYVFGWSNLDIPLPADVPLEMSIQYEGIQLGDAGSISGSSIPGPNMIRSSSSTGTTQINQPMAVRITVSN